LPTLKLHYDGWLTLPAGLRQALGLKTGDRLVAELADGALMLRPVSRTRQPATDEDTAVPIEAQAAETPAPVADATPARRKPVRPRKSPEGGECSAGPKRAPGRPRKAALGREPDSTASPQPVLGPPKLLKKADLEAKTTAPEPPAPVTRPAMRIRPDRISQPVERRPFRNVEIRPLGRGRRHSERF
jgi:bifunctional DNA-binding transcriptional regulator/antitoxin component of YhaV-PrlF toxin-antitoxin module